MSGQAADMCIAVYGSGYVGMTATGRGKHGYAGRLLVNDPDPNKLVTGAVANGKLPATRRSNGLVNAVEIPVACVGTSSPLAGSHNMSQIAEFTRQIAAAFGPGKRCHTLTLVFRRWFSPQPTADLPEFD